MLPWIPMSPPGCCLRSATYTSGEASATVALAHSWSSVRDVNTCFGVVLMNVANGSTSEVGQ